jgi:hypothetical protein
MAIYTNQQFKYYIRQGGSMKIKFLTMILANLAGTSILLQPEKIYAQTTSNDSISVQNY